jgi:succinate dehydrogenase hydrophobic anchor subunit
VLVLLGLAAQQLRRPPLAVLSYGRTDLPFDLATLGMFAVSAVLFGARAVWGVLHDTSRTRQTRAAIHYSWLFAVFAAIVAIGTFHVL